MVNTTNPDISVPGTSNPDSANPDTKNPDASNPDSSNPGITNLDTSKPSACYPDKTTNGYEDIRLLGSGGSGRVSLCIHAVSRNTYVKKEFSSHLAMPLTWVGDQEVPLEIAYLMSLNHPNIVRYKTHFWAPERDSWSLIMDYDKDLTELYRFSRTHHLEPEMVVRIGQQLHDVISFLFRNNIDHGDIKEENILIHPKTAHIKLIDFGTALPLRKPGEDCLGKMGYGYLRGTVCCLPPEAFKTPRYMPMMTTVWAFGCVLYGCITGTSAFLSPAQVTSKRARIPADIGNKIPGFLRDMVERCLDPNPITRIPWSEIKKSLG